MSPTLSILGLADNAVLLPGGRITFSASKSVGEALLGLIETSDGQPVLGVVPTTPNISEYGSVARVIRLVRPSRSHSPFVVSLLGLSRFKIPVPETCVSTDELVEATVEHLADDEPPSTAEVAKFKGAALRLLERLAVDATHPPRKEGWAKIQRMLDDITALRASWMADVLAAAIFMESSHKLGKSQFLCTPSVSVRLGIAAARFTKQASEMEMTAKVASAVDESLSKQQKEFFLRQQLAAIQRLLQDLSTTNSRTEGESAGPSSSGNLPANELDDEAHDSDDLNDLKLAILSLRPDSEERKMGVREYRRLRRIPQQSVENGVIRSYLEWLVAVPWSTTAPTTSTSRAFLANARAQLDADHFGLEQVKKRLIEYLAVVRLKEMNSAREDRETVRRLEESTSETSGKEFDTTATPTPSSPPRRTGVKGPILLFVGPPGTGKTSLGLSIAKALARPFQRVALGGVRDEAEIRGHRRTYVASGPGCIVQALRKAGQSNPVILLDEIDKVGHGGINGDPSAALLEVLDPEQNWSFNDHYINVPVDLSEVLFIATANSLETIPAPLLDRCEIVQLSGYTYDEKMHIAKKWLLPKQLYANGLGPAPSASSATTIVSDDPLVKMSEAALLHIVTQYTREAGVRSLERAIGAVVRFKAVEWAEYVDSEDDAGIRKTYNSVVEEPELEAILGVARRDGEEKEREEHRGIVYGLVVMGQGEGGILPVETIAVPGSGSVKLTGSLGDVIKESSEIALSWVKMHAYDLGITNTRAQDPLKIPNLIDVHLHLPAGAQKKDGPSAGVAMTCAFVSLLTGACVPAHIAMTGEITLRGRVTPVGGIKEKVLGAHRAQITKVILPWANRKDVEHDVAREVRDDMTFVFVKTIEEALTAAFGEGVLNWRRGSRALESRL